MNLNFHRRVVDLLERLPYWDLALQAAAASGISLVSSIGVLAFKWAIVWIQSLAYDQLGGWLSQFGGWTTVFIPAIGGLLVGLMLFYWIKVERHHGVAGVIEAAALAGGRLRYGRMPLKALASAISIGSGASVGPEDPSV